MSDEPDVPLTNLEDDTPPAAPVAEAPPPVAATPPDAEPAPVEAVEVAGQKYVPLGAVLAERKEKNALKDKAAKADQLEGWVNENRAYIDFLRANPDFLTRPQQPQEPPVPAAPQADPDAEEAARLMDFYTTDGKPDVEKGARWLKLQDKRAQAAANQLIQPVQQQSMQQQMHANYQRVLQVKDPAGHQANPQTVAAIFQQLAADPKGLASAADPRMAPIIAMWAMGADRMVTQPTPPPPPSPPLVTEAPGGEIVGQRAPLSKAEEAILRNRGMSQTKYQELTKGFKPGHATILED